MPWNHDVVGKMRGLFEPVAIEPTNGIEDRDNKRSLAWRVFFEASTRLQGLLEAQLKAGANLSLSDYNILLMLYESPQQKMRMGELAERLGFIPSRLTYLVSGLIKEGWVDKRP